MRYWSYFWGGAEKRFEYDQHSLNDHLYWQMVESGYLGVACEPNCVFQICNQPAILGFRMHDLVHGGSRADEVTRGYEQAWKEFGRIGDNGHYNIMMAQDTQGNVLLGYARLNIPDGLWRLYNEPWPAWHADAPALTRVASNVDVAKALFDPSTRRLEFSLHRRDDLEESLNADGAVLIGNVSGQGAWTLRCDNQDVAQGSGDALTQLSAIDLSADASGITLRCPDGVPHQFVMTFESV
ncbi:MAG: hypothetical protein JWP52_3593 [Rhizobacter sp.]|nr:hypothetical protein [Rhizobacter sp.]